MKRASEPVTLTPRQKQIISLASEGKTYKQIAVKLCIAEDTVRSHLTTVRLKLNANNTVRAVCLAIGSGII